MLRLHGITPVMATCFHEDESVDEDALRRQIDAAIAGGAAAVCAPALGGEFYKLSDQERYRIVQVLVEHTRNRVTTIAATTAGSVRNALEFSSYTENLGADCVMVAAPRYVPLPPQDIVRYYDRLCSGVAIPVMLQDADFSGLGLPTSVFKDLATRHLNFQFVKLEVPLPGPRCADIVTQTQGRVQVIYGNGGLRLIEGLHHGAAAIMPSSACLEVYVKIYELHKRGYFGEARSLFRELLPFISFAQQHLELAVYVEKRILREREILPSARMREPTLSLGGGYQEEVDRLVSEVVELCSRCSA